MDKQKLEALVASASDAKSKAEAAGGTDANLNKIAEDATKAVTDAEAALSQSPLEQEAERVRKEKEGTKRTEKEKAAFALKNIVAKFPDLKADLGIGEGTSFADDDDNAPVTRGELKRIEAERSKNTALDMASTIQDQTERDLVIHHLKTTINPSGNAEQDFKAALSIVSAAKNPKILEELARTTKPRTHGSGGGAPPKREVEFTPTAEEAAMMRPPFNLSKDKILKAREQFAATQQ